MENAQLICTVVTSSPLQICDNPLIHTQRRICSEGVVDPWIGDLTLVCLGHRKELTMFYQVGLEFIEVHVESSIEPEIIIVTIIAIIFIIIITTNLRLAVMEEIIWAISLLRLV